MGAPQDWERGQLTALPNPKARGAACRVCLLDPDRGNPGIGGGDMTVGVFPLCHRTLTPWDGGHRVTPHPAKPLTLSTLPSWSYT